MKWKELLLSRKLKTHGLTSCSDRGVPCMAACKFNSGNKIQLGKKWAKTYLPNFQKEKLPKEMIKCHSQWRVSNVQV